MTIATPNLPVLSAREARQPTSKQKNRALEALALTKLRGRGETATSAKPRCWGAKLTRGLACMSKLATLPRSIYNSRHGRVQMPRLLTHTITFGCNARCVMCDSWKLPTQDDLSLDEIHGVYSQLPPMDVVRLTGGEPFIRTDLPQILELARRLLKPLLVYVSSNGFLTERIVGFCEHRDRNLPLELAISLDGVDDYHNQIRGSGLAFRSAWKTLETLAARRRELNLTLSVNQTVVDDQGLKQYELLHSRLAALGIEHHLVVAYDESATYSLERNRQIEWQPDGFNAFAALDEELLASVLAKADEHARQLPWHRRIARTYYLRGLAERTLRGRSTRRPICQALHTHLRIFPNGDVPVCQFNSQAVGNFRHQYFAEIWSGVLAGKQRSWVHKCEGCWAECEVLPNALYTLEILKRA